MRTFLIDGVDVGGATRMGFSFTTGAMRGEVGVGGLLFDDPSSASTIGAWKSCTVTESLASPQRMFTGETGVRNLGRGDSMVLSTDRQWDVDLVDLNSWLTDRVLTLPSGDRDVETDFARVTWLLTTSAMTGPGISGGTVPNTNVVTMEATDYRGKTPMEVLDDCAEASGKNFFVYYSGGALLYYDVSAPVGGIGGAAFASGCRISNVKTDLDSVTFAPSTGWKRTLDPTAVYSDIEAEFGQEPVTGRIIVTNATTAATYKTRMKSVTLGAKTVDGATVKANQFLDAASDETETISGLTIVVPAAQVNDILAGHRIEVKLNGAGLPSFVWRRVTRRTVRPFGDSNDFYEMDLELMPKTKSTRFVGDKPKVILDTEHIPNGNMESGPENQDGRVADWIVVSGQWRTYDAPSPVTTAKPKPKGGKRALRVEQDVASVIRTQNLAPVEGTERYLFTGWAMWNVGAIPTRPTVKVQWFDASKTSISTTSAKGWAGTATPWAVTAKWRKFSFIFHAPDTAAFRRIILTNPIGTAGRYVYFDEFRFRHTDQTSLTREQMG